MNFTQKRKLAARPPQLGHDLEHSLIVRVAPETPDKLAPNIGANEVLKEVSLDFAMSTDELALKLKIQIQTTKEAILNPLRVKQASSKTKATPKQDISDHSLSALGFAVRIIGVTGGLANGIELKERTCGM
jgi:hypothetical protein